MACSRNGFTLMEVSLAAVILGILVTIAVNRFGQTIAFNELEKTSSNVHREISSIRTVALKNDCPVFVRFSTQRCSLFVDLNENGTIDAGEFDRLFIISTPVGIGIAQDGPLYGPEGIDFADKGIAGNWKTAMTVSTATTGAINSGAIYLRSTRMKKKTFCVGLAGTKQLIKIYSWDGTKWSIM